MSASADVHGVCLLGQGSGWGAVALGGAVQSTESSNV